MTESDQVTKQPASGRQRAKRQRGKTLPTYLWLTGRAIHCNQNRRHSQRPLSREENFPLPEVPFPRRPTGLSNRATKPKSQWYMRPRARLRRQARRSWLPLLRPHPAAGTSYAPYPHLTSSLARVVPSTFRPLTFSFSLFSLFHSPLLSSSPVKTVQYFAVRCTQRPSAVAPGPQLNSYSRTHRRVPFSGKHGARPGKKKLRLRRRLFWIPAPPYSACGFRQGPLAIIEQASENGSASAAASTTPAGQPVARDSSKYLRLRYSYALPRCTTSTPTPSSTSIHIAIAIAKDPHHHLRPHASTHISGSILPCARLYLTVVTPQPSPGKNKKGSRPGSPLLEPSPKHHLQDGPVLSRLIHLPATAFSHRRVGLATLSCASTTSGPEYPRVPHCKVVDSFASSPIHAAASSLSPATSRLPRLATRLVKE